MAHIYDSLTQLVGHTPLLALNRLTRHVGAQAQVWAKLEYFNPGGSVKDRVALSMIQHAEEEGILRPGSVIVEPTSGNTGVGLAWIARVRGYECIIVMPDTMSRERQLLLRAAGATLVLTPGAEGMKGAIDEAERIVSTNTDAVLLGQFTNPANPQAHYCTTGPEIWTDTDGRVDVFVAGVGTGGTISGVGRYLKERNPAVEIVAVEPTSSPLLSGGQPAPHKIQGIGANFIPSTYDPAVVDRIIPVSDDDAFHASRALSTHEGLIVGISSGAAVHAALQLATDPRYTDKRIVTLLPDTGERYLSTPLYDF